ncbi:unnamed protein product [Trifolium pratense]|uniref:Uncharacterized protein n=1 Tax=Trifolium pratense TaxID=57577 RepID=A0ACB0KN61_TRIPR|nr:unnamed protein product [Trifolium pratense]
MMVHEPPTNGFHPCLWLLPHRPHIGRAISTSLNGVPSLLSDLSSLYDHSGKHPFTNKFILVQHYDRRGQSEISLSKVDEAEASGMDESHWLVVCEPPFEIKFVQIYADYYAKLLEPYVGSEKEAKKIIYSISKEIYFGFGAVLTEETVKNLRGLFFFLQVYLYYLRQFRSLNFRTRRHLSGGT